MPNESKQWIAVVDGRAHRLVSEVEAGGDVIVAPLFGSGDRRLSREAWLRAINTPF